MNGNHNLKACLKEVTTQAEKITVYETIRLLKLPFRIKA